MGADGHVITVPLSRIPESFASLAAGRLVPPAMGWAEVLQEHAGWKVHPGLHGGEAFAFVYWDTEHHDADGYPSLATWFDELRDYERAIAHPSRQGENDQAALRRQIDRLTPLIGDRTRAEQALELRDWLTANAEDWEVWT
jgi:hypothetical protein